MQDDPRIALLESAVVVLGLREPASGQPDELDRILALNTVTAAAVERTHS